MRLLLIRHGLPERLELADGTVADPSLSDTGRRQAQALAAALADEPIDAIYTSPAARARETAQPLAARHAVEPVTREELLEFDFGASSYIPLEEVEFDEHPHYEDWMAWLQPLADGGPAARFRERITAAMGAIVAAHRSQTVAVVSHGGTINAYLTGLMGIDRGLIFLPDYTSVSRLEVASSGFWTLDCLNDRTHLVRSDDPIS